MFVLLSERKVEGFKKSLKKSEFRFEDPSRPRDEGRKETPLPFRFFFFPPIAPSLRPWSHPWREREREKKRNKGTHPVSNHACSLSTDAFPTPGSSFAFTSALT